MATRAKLTLSSEDDLLILVPPVVAEQTPKPWQWKVAIGGTEPTPYWQLGCAVLSLRQQEVMDIIAIEPLPLSTTLQLLMENLMGARLTVQEAATDTHSLVHIDKSYKPMVNDVVRDVAFAEECGKMGEDS